MNDSLSCISFFPFIPVYDAVALRGRQGALCGIAVLIHRHLSAVAFTIFIHSQVLYCGTHRHWHADLAHTIGIDVPIQDHTVVIKQIQLFARRKAVQIDPYIILEPGKQLFVAGAQVAITSGVVIHD